MKNVRTKQHTVAGNVAVRKPFVLYKTNTEITSQLKDQI